MVPEEEYSFKGKSRLKINKVIVLKQTCFSRKDGVFFSRKK